MNSIGAHWTDLPPAEVLPNSKYKKIIEPIMIKMNHHPASRNDKNDKIYLGDAHLGDLPPADVLF